MVTLFQININTIFIYNYDKKRSELMAELTTEEQLRQEQEKLRRQQELLDKYKQEAQGVEGQPIPERKYGSRITKGVQQQYVQRQQEARQYLSNLSQSEQQIQGYQSEVSGALTEIQAEKEARRLWRRGISYYWYKGKPEYKYLKDLYKKYGAYNPKTLVGGYTSTEGKEIGYYKDKYGNISEEVIAEYKQKPFSQAEYEKIYSSPDIAGGYTSVTGESVTFVKQPAIQQQTFQPIKIQEKKSVQGFIDNVLFGQQKVKPLKQGQTPIPFKKNIATKVSEGFGIITSKIAEPIEKALPQKNIYQYIIKDILTKKQYKPIDVTGIIKTGFFVPATTTTGEIISSATISKRITSKTRTSFYSEVKASPEFTEVTTISATELGGRNTFDLVTRQIRRKKGDITLGLSKSFVKDIDNKQSVALSKILTLEKAKGGGINIKRFKSIGQIQELGMARAVKTNPKTTFDLGEGQSSLAFFKETGGVRSRNVYDLITGKARRINTRLKLNKNIQEGNIIGGVVKNVGEGEYAYVGTTNPFMRYYKTGRRSLIIKEANIKGIIKTSAQQEEKDIFGNLLTKQSTKLSKPVQKEIQTQVGTIIGKVKADIQNKQIIKQYTKPVQSTRQSLFYGTGQYERTTGGALQTDFITTETRTRQNFNIISTQRDRTGLRNKPALKDLSAQIPRTNQLNIPSFRERTIQRQRFNLRLAQPQVTKQPTKLITPNITKTPTLKIPILPVGFNLKGKGKSFLSKIFGYKTFYLKKGKRVYLGGVRTKGEAIRRGEEFTLSNLRATFGVKKTAVKITGTERTYQPSSKYFRSYRISKGKKVPLKDIFIQKKGQRLAFKPEIREIQLARVKGGII